MLKNEYKPRLTAPEKWNPYYNRKATGGYNPCKQGKPTTQGANVLANCVGYAVGRFNEIGGYNCCKYLGSTNAENFIDDFCNNQGLAVSHTPTLGGCMVWSKGKLHDGADGCGHVAIVEQINADGSIITSDSGYNSISFYTKKRSGENWGQSTEYKYQGCIINPAVKSKIYRVQVGAFENRDYAADYCKQLRESGIDCFVVEVEI